MKKVLEDELMSLAHRILKLRNRAEIHELKEEAAVLYEKLSVLSFAEKYFELLDFRAATAIPQGAMVTSADIETK